MDQKHGSSLNFLGNKMGWREFLRWSTAAGLAWPLAHCRGPEAPESPVDARWVEEQLAQLSLEERVGQVICVAPASVQAGVELLRGEFSATGRLPVELEVS